MIPQFGGWEKVLGQTYIFGNWKHISDIYIMEIIDTTQTESIDSSLMDI